MKASRSIGYRYRAALALISLLTTSIPAFAQGGVPGYPESVLAFDPREVAPLPRYCMYTQLFREKFLGNSEQAQFEHWQAVMGGVFNAMHHYCFGMMKANRAGLPGVSQQFRLFYLREAVADFDYVIDRAPANFVLLPEILTKKGENLIRLGDAPLAIQAFFRAIELKPDYWPPYVSVSDYYKALGDISKARDVLEKALSFSPDANAVKRRLAELDTAQAKSKTPPPRPPAGPATPKRGPTP